MTHLSVAAGNSSSDDATEAQWRVACEALEAVYGNSPGFQSWLGRVRDRVDSAIAARAPALVEWDRAAPADGWWRAASVVGYSAYVDRFAGTLAALPDRLPYLSDLGVSYLHLLPLLKPRAGESDGGYAVADFEDVNPALGTLDDFQRMLDMARIQGVNVVIDLICNHVADDHRWAVAARQGDPRYRDYFHFMRTDAEVAAWEEVLIDIFPDSAPGSFTRVDEADAWVWTTFYPYQWDLNYANPDVFLEMTSVILNLANRGVAGFRLDSTAFLWKEAGTNSRNRPEVHRILTAWRALLSMLSPAVVLKAEAIERLPEVLPYFGETRPECDLAYNNGVMAALWASIALGSGEPARRLIAEAAAKPDDGVWINYVRCHDDIIFSALSPAVSPADQREAALRLTDRRPDCFGRGEVFQEFNGVPSVNGMTASLVGMDDPSDPWGASRLVALYALCFALDGAPVIYMGDELALANDEAWRTDPERAGEGRWLQRPAMDWGAAGSGDATGVGSAFRRMIAIRRGREAFDARSPLVLSTDGPDPVVSFTRGAGDGRVQILVNLSDRPTQAPTVVGAPAWRDLLSDRVGTGEIVEMAPYQALWLEVVR